MLLLVGVCREEVDGFVAGNGLVGDWLGKYREGRSRFNHARVLTRFFKWLRAEKGLDVSPDEFLRLHLEKRGSADIQDRCWALGLLLRFSRDNPDFAGLTEKRRYYLFSVVRGFFDFCEAPVTTAKNVYGREKKKRKYKPKQISIDQAKRILGLLNQRDRTVLLVMLQSGMGAGDVIDKFNHMLGYVQSCLKSGVERIRISLPERKGNGMPYFTFISRDAIHELKKWMIGRERILEETGNGEGKRVIFVSKHGTPLTLNTFENSLTYHFRKHKISDGPYSVTSHMFRKLFKTESRPPERGIDPQYVEFMMGHLSGIDSVGGIYDKTPELYEDVVEREYEKLERFLNIYTMRPASQQGFTDREMQILKKWLQNVENGDVRP